MIDAVDYIAALRQATDLSTLPVGRRVVVIGGGMTAIDIAVQSKRLGAEDVTIVYRRGPEQMKASAYEQELAQTSGVVIRHWARPEALEGHGGALSGVVFEYTQEQDGALASHGLGFRIEADVLFKAIGQRGPPEALDGAGLEVRDGRIVVDAERRTNLERVWAGGDCVFGGKDLTVSAVEDGKQAARSIAAALGAPRLTEARVSWPISAPTSSASNRPIRSGSPPPRPPTQGTMSSARSAPAGAAWCGRRWAKPARRSSTYRARATARSMDPTAG